VTPRETIIKAFELGKPERVPVTLFGGGMWSIKDYGTSFEELATNVDKNVDMCVTEAAKIRSDVVYVGSGFNNFHAYALTKKYGVNMKYREIGAPDLTDHVVHSEEDIAKLDINDIHKEPVIQGIMEATRRVKEKIGKERLVTMTCWGPFTLAARFVGEEPFMKHTFKKPAKVSALLDKLADVIIATAKELESAGPDYITVREMGATSDVLSPRVFKSMILPPLQKIIKEMGKVCKQAL